MEGLFLVRSAAMQQWKLALALTRCIRLALRQSAHSLEVLKCVVNEEVFFKHMLTGFFLKGASSQDKTSAHGTSFT